VGHVAEPKAWAVVGCEGIPAWPMVACATGCGFAAGGGAKGRSEGTCGTDAEEDGKGSTPVRFNSVVPASNKTKTESCCECQQF